MRVKRIPTAADKRYAVGAWDAYFVALSGVNGDGRGGSKTQHERSDGPEGWVDMVSWGGPGMRALAGTKLRDFEIQAAAEVGRCAGAQSFRAVRRGDGASVLLHKFRPAKSLLELGPMLESAEPPDVTRPFMTRFTDLFAVAGSAYLVEPLPASIHLSDVWRHLLLNRPHQARAFASILTHHLLALVRHLSGRERSIAALSIENIVLTGPGGFAILAAGIRCEEGLLWLRKEPQESFGCDHRTLAEVLRRLLDMEDEIADLRGAPALLSADSRDGILQLSHAVERSRCRARL